MTGNICQCFPCFQKEKKKWNVPKSCVVNGYDVLYIEVQEKDKVEFEEKRPSSRELCLNEYMALYSYVTDNQLPRPFDDSEYECFYFLNGDRVVILQGWVPKKRAPWMRPPLPIIPKENICLIGKFREAKTFAPAKRYEVKEYNGEKCETDPIHSSSCSRPLLNILRKQHRPRSPKFSQLLP